MKRARGIAAAGVIVAVGALTAGDAAAQQRYGWAVSKLPNHYCGFHGSFPGGEVVTLYLWLAYAGPDGMSAADITAVCEPPSAATILSFTRSPGFLNAGSATDLLLQSGECAEPPIMVGTWTIQTTGIDWHVCLGGLNSTVNCGEPPFLFPNDSLGYTNGSFGFCSNGWEWKLTGCGVTNSGSELDLDSWATIKSLYR